MGQVDAVGRHVAAPCRRAMQKQQRFSERCHLGPPPAGSMPALADGRLYFGGGDRLVCHELPKR